VPNSKDPDGHPLDPIGSALSIIGLVSLVFAIIEGPERGWSDPLVVVGFVLAAVGLAAFVTWERRARFPMLDPAYFRIPRFAVSAMTITVTFFVMFAMFFSLSQYFQFVRSYSPLKTGFAILPFALTMVVVAPRGPKVQQRITVRGTIAVGMALVGVGAALLAFIGPDTPYVLVVGSIMLMALGAGLAMPSATTGIMASLPMSKAGVGSAVNDTTREVGGAVGIAVVGSVLASVYRAGLDDAEAMLPAGSRDVARDNIGAAVKEGADILSGDAAAHQRFLDIVGSAFTDGFNAGMGVSSAMALLGALAVLRWYPREVRPAGLPPLEPSADELAEAGEGAGGVGANR
jgi:hypothetical protein